MNAIEKAKRLVEQGNGLIGTGKLAAALSKFEEALRLLPGHPGVLNNLGVVLEKLGRLEEALDKYETVRRLTPPHPGLLNNCAVVLRKLGRPAEALERFDQALSLKSDYAEALANRGKLLVEQLNSPADGLASLDRSLELRPDHADTLVNRAIALTSLDRPIEAIASYERALAIRPDYAEARAHKLYQQAMICDWKTSPADAAAVATLGISGESISPFTLLALEDAPARHRRRAERFVKDNFAAVKAHEIPRPTVEPQRLRIGYFSPDFYNHAVMQLVVQLFEMHDRDRFSIHAYSFGPDVNDAMRSRVHAAMDSFQDVSGLSDAGVAARARKDKIDIAVDLAGFTKGSRPAIFAHRAAPLQVSYVGFTATMGAPFIDYVVGDRILIPQELQQHYSEKIIYLPDSYMANDNTKQISARAMMRVDEDLPEHGIIFCCFNNSYKITRMEFDIWMRLLQKVDGSVLWLLKTNTWAEQNLCMEARKRGIDPARLVFAKRAPLPEHLARQRLADILLDTFAYNAHTTATDALWVGLPVVTKAGQGFAARVAASVLFALGIPELVTFSEEEYERLALELATTPAKLEAIKQKVVLNRDSTALFDTARLARHLEDGYRQIYRRYFEGGAPAHTNAGAPQ
jgi:protein O-GlcNAc transferase